jgi:uncharacterized membrane protein
MHFTQQKKLVLIITFIIFLMIILALVRSSYLLAIAGVLTGIIVWFLLSLTNTVKTDERELSVQEKASTMSFSVFLSSTAVIAFLLLFPSKSGWSVFSKGEWLFIESFGTIFAYLTFLLIIIYVIAYYFFNRQLGGGMHEK